MAFSAVEVHKDSFDVFNSMHLKEEYKYAFFKIGSAGGFQKAVIPDFTEPMKAGSGSLEEERSAWQEMKEKLASINDDARYVLYDFRHESPDTGRHINAVICVFWRPSGISIRTRMEYSSAWDGVKQAFNSVRMRKACEDATSLDFDGILNEALQKLSL